MIKMGLLGKGAMVFWHDLSIDSSVDYQDWHSHEHLTERISVPGFLRGRRCAAIRGGQSYFIMYEVEDISVLISPPYLERLNQPTPWTKRALGYFRNTNRTLCRTVFTRGIGLGGLILTIRFSVQAGREMDLEDWFRLEFLPSIFMNTGLTGGHLLRSDESASLVETEEKKLRDKPDQISDWVLIIEGYDENALDAISRDELSSENLVSRGVLVGRQSGLYQYLHGLSERGDASL